MLTIFNCFIGIVDAMKRVFAYLGVFESVRNGKEQGKDAPKTGDCVIGFTGSINDENWSRNFQFNKREATKVIASFDQLDDDEMKFHTGFMKIWNVLSANKTL